MSTEYFDRAAAEWDGKSRRVLLAEKIAAAILELPLSDKMSGMEYGCGTGLVGIAIAPSLKSLTAVDTSRGMLAELQKKVDEGAISNIQTLYCDLSSDAYRKKHDLIFCVMTLHHIENAQGLLQHFTELLNPGGYLAIVDLVTEDGSFHKASAEGIHHYGFDPGELATLLEDLGMEELKDRVIHSIVKEENNTTYPVFLLAGRKLRQ
jgi:2-polyprenyl-3-methyl-5-hydroxy-6-metoxy-1,4-benzoquinol methylase